MKSLVPWICFFAASTAQQAFAENEFNAYRLGNYNKAAEPLLSKSGQDAVADYYLGRLYLYGYGQLKNMQLAIRYFTKSAQKGFLPAVLLMAKYSLFEEKNPEQTVAWYKQAATAGDVSAQLFMAAASLYGYGVKQNVDVASHYFIDAAKNGNAIAQFALAESFLDSKHSENNKLGLIWLTKAANNGNPRAIAKLGSLYVDSKLVPKDLVKAQELLNQAAAQNDVSAMIWLGKVAQIQNDNTLALQWFNKAANEHNAEAYLALAHAYLQDKSPIYDAKNGFLWTLKAAQDGLIPAKVELANLYKNGIGVTASEDLSKQWADQAALDEKKPVQVAPLTKMALWLSNGKTNKMEETSYQMNGILGAWKNTTVLRNNIYNQAPRFKRISRKELFKPQFVLIQPNDIPINDYYDALVSKKFEFKANEWTYPFYPLNKQIEALQRAYSPVVAKNNLPAPYIDASYYTNEDSNQSLLDLWTPDWQKYANYMSVFNQMYFRAILGDAQSQFEIGQMFQYGIGVTQNHDSAIIFYQNATEQKHLGAEYELGLLLIEHAKTPADYQAGLNWLTDAAFKGNKKSQYVLARILTDGKTIEDGTVVIKPNKEQAMSMLYLSAANDYGPAEYELAEHLAREYNNGLSVTVRQHKITLIRELYEGAARHGVAQALIPLAYYNAMSNSLERQQQAFKVAEKQADLDDDKAALLLGMLYDRGIGVSIDPAKAMYWYQHAGDNPVNEFILGTYKIEGRGMAEDKSSGMELLKLSSQEKFAYADFNLAVLKEELHDDFLPDLITAYELGNSHAGILLADYYLSENNDPDRMNQARAIYTGLADKGDQYAQLKLAFMMDKGLGSTPDPLGAQRWYTASAEQGNAQAQYLLGQFYLLGELGQPDYTLAKEWYQKAAKHLAKASVALGFIYETVDDNYTDALKAYEQAAGKGDVLGNYNLGLMYEYGKGIPVDYQKAKALFTIAADKNINEAMNQLGGMYFYGLGEEKNVQQALSWYRKAADLGNNNALYTLGLLSETGVGTKLDFPNALKYYKEAADKGNEKAMLALARMYHYGLGVTKDPKVSAEIYQKLAERQNAYAQYQLGTYYLDGIAVERSAEKGRQLLEQASENGSTQARKTLRRLDAQAQAKVSYIEPVTLNRAPILSDLTADLIYLEALNEWNRGHELMSRMMLQRLMAQYPHFTPAKKALEQLKQTIYG